MYIIFSLRNTVYGFRGPDGRGHFYRELISFWRRALSKNIEKYANLKVKIYGFFPLIINSLWVNTSYLKILSTCISERIKSDQTALNQMKSYKHTSTFSSYQINLFYGVRKVYFEVTSKRHRLFCFSLGEIRQLFSSCKIIIW